MHEAALSRAALPEPAVVLEMLLRPLSLGHVISFSRHDFLGSISSGELNPLQLAAAVHICCRNWEQTTSINSDMLEPLKFLIWKQRVKRASKRFTGNYHEFERAKFSLYLKAGASEFPISDTPRPDNSQPGRQPGAPFILRLHQWLVDFMRLTESQAWDYQFGLAKMRWACHLEAQGGVDIENDADDSFNRFVREQEAMAN